MSRSTSGPTGLSNRLHRLQGVLLLALGDDLSAVAERIPFHGRESPIHHGLGLAGHRLGGVLGLGLGHRPLEGPGIGVGPNPVSQAPSQQLVHGNAQRLALDVPQGLLHPAQGGQLDELPIPEGLLVEGVPDEFDPVGVLADEKVPEGLQRPDQQGIVALHGGLPHAGQTHVGVELHEDPVGVASGHVEHSQIGDFQG